MLLLITAALCLTFGGRLGPQGMSSVASAVHPSAERTDTAVVSVERPTLIAYFVIPDGTDVDTLPDLAAAADDWNYAMAALGDSLHTRGIPYVLVTQPYLRLRVRAGDETVVLGHVGDAGFALVRPGEPPYLVRGDARVQSALRALDWFLRSNRRHVIGWDDRFEDMQDLIGAVAWTVGTPTISWPIGVARSPIEEGANG